MYEATRSSTFINKLRKYDGIVLLPSLYDLRDGSKPIKLFETATEILTTIKDNTNALLLLSQSAPTRTCLSEIATLNSLIKSYTEYDERTQPILLLDYFVRPKSKTLDKDSSLLPLGAEFTVKVLIALVISEHCSTTIDLSPDSATNFSTDSAVNTTIENDSVVRLKVYEVVADSMKHIVGVGAKMLKQLESDSAAKVFKVKWSEDGNEANGVIVKGTTGQILKVKAAIDLIVNNKCHFFAQDGCKNGDKCKFTHEESASKKTKS